ncbi:MAG TPA: hypothetical protein VNZ61_22000 [Roseomonas sp.]|nr:hypothetical protein [Roseomonas sp.]
MTAPPLSRRYTTSLDYEAALALEHDAAVRGVDVADHITSILEEYCLKRLLEDGSPARERLRAASMIKAATAEISRRIVRENGVQPDHTLQVFRELRLQHTAVYLRATACETGFEAGKPLKHSLNLVLGAISKRAAGAKVRMLPNGQPEKIRNIRGEFCSSVTVLEPGNEGK